MAYPPLDGLSLDEWPRWHPATQAIPQIELDLRDVLRIHRRKAGGAVSGKGPFTDGVLNREACSPLGPISQPSMVGRNSGESP
jgi:hypothetical protein